MLGGEFDGATGAQYDGGDALPDATPVGSASQSAEPIPAKTSGGSMGGGAGGESAEPLPPYHGSGSGGHSEAFMASNGNGNGGSATMQEDAANKLKAAKHAVFANGGFPLLVFIASVVLMIAASSTCNKTNYCSGRYGWAVAAGVISLVVSFIYLFLERKDNLEPKYRLGMTVFLFLWWVLVASLCTFGDSAPFETPGNGYFAAWGGLFGTLFMLMNEVGKVRDAVDRFSRVGHKVGILLVASLVVMFAGVAECDHGCSGEAGYAIACGAISFAVVLARVFLDAKLNENSRKFYNLFIVLWWVAGFIILTFVGPFETVGNGYFATWACLIAAILLIDTARPSAPEHNEEEAIQHTHV